MKKIILLTAFLLICWLTFASKLVVSADIGFNANNSTQFLQQAFNTVTDTIVIDNVGMPWRTEPLYVNQSNITVIIEPNVLIQAISGAYGEFDSLLRIWDKENIDIIGYGATIQMNKQEYVSLNDSEFRHGVNIGSATNVSIEGLTIIDTGGDGILISKSFDPSSTKNYCEDIIIKNCVFDNNYRQGISITSVKNTTITNCILSNTNGTLPEAGIDIEPDNPDERIENLTISGCRLENNNGSGIQVALLLLDDTSQDVSILIEDTYFSGNHDPSNIYAYSEIICNDNSENGVDGLVTFRNCYIENSDWTGAYINKTVDSYDLLFDNCVFKNVSQDPIDFNNPIFFEVTDYSNPVARFGGANFVDCTIDYEANIPFLDVIGNVGTSDGLGNVSGNFFIINPNSVDFETGPDPQNVNITFEYFNEHPTTTVNIEANQSIYFENEGLPIGLIGSRTSEELIPIAISLDNSGEATYGTDYNLFPKFIIIDNGATSNEIDIDIVEDTTVEIVETANFSIIPNSCYVIGNNGSFEILIYDDESLGLDEINNAVTYLFPNPANERITIISENNFWKIENIEFYSSDGRLINIPVINDNENINIEFLSAGNYILKIYGKDGILIGTKKLIKF